MVVLEIDVKLRVAFLFAFSIHHIVQCSLCVYHATDISPYILNVPYEVSKETLSTYISKFTYE